MKQSDRCGQELPSNQLTMWVVGTRKDDPTDESSMSCWESCLYTGFKAGIFSKGLIVQIYKLAVAHTHQTARKEMSKLAETIEKPTVDMVAQPVQAAYVRGRSIVRLLVIDTDEERKKFEGGSRARRQGGAREPAAAAALSWPPRQAATC